MKFPERVALSAGEVVVALGERAQKVEAEGVQCEREHNGLVVYLAAYAEKSEAVRLCVFECHTHVLLILLMDKCVTAFIDDVAVNVVSDLAWEAEERGLVFILFGTTNSSGHV